jgi:hypothetical protein
VYNDERQRMGAIKEYDNIGGIFFILILGIAI